MTRSFDYSVDRFFTLTANRGPRRGHGVRSRSNKADVVFVPVRGPRVEIHGSVIRRGIYKLKDDEGLRALLDLAGGSSRRRICGA